MKFFTKSLTFFCAFWALVCCSPDKSVDVKEGPGDLKIQPIVSFFKNTISSEEVLKNVKGTKKGYTLKEVKNISDSAIATFEKKEKEFFIKLKKVGKFTADIVLAHPVYRDFTFSKVVFEIKKSVAEKLTSPKLSKNFATKGTFSEQEILKNITGKKDGYTLKEISNLNPTDFAKINSDKKSISFLKPGNFTANILLEHPTKQDVSISKAQFEIKKSAAEKLTFPKLSKNFATKGTFSEQEILKNITGKKDGYTLKEISNLNPTDFAKINSDKKSISFLKPGTFTANILLEHPTKQDVSIPKAAFEIAKAVSKNQLTFPKLSENFATNGIFSEQEILNNITGKKDGYTLKSISNLNPTGIAKINSNKKSISFLKPGNFTANILLEHPTKQDVTIQKAPFEIAKATSRNQLTFPKLSKNFTDKGTFSEQEILKNITGKKDGYTLKSISNLNPTDFAKINGDKKSISFLKPGNFTANILLEHPTKQDVTIQKAPFEIAKATSRNQLTFPKLSKNFTDKGTFSEQEILKNITGKKDGYTLKSISNLNPTDFAKINGDKKSISFLKPGTFTANILLEHPTKQDVSIPKAAFEIAKAVSKNQLTFPKLSKNFTTKGTFSEQEILNNITGKKDGYTLKEISNLNPTDFAKINSNKKSISFLKPGNFTATIVLEHSTKQDVSISKAQFEIAKAVSKNQLTFPKLSKNFATNGTFSEQEILKNITGKKDGYTLKEISNLNPTDFAKINSDKKSISFLKPGNFTANILLEHPTKQDVSISKAQFEIAKAVSKNQLTFPKLSKNFATNGTFSEQEILNNITGKKDGYTLKEISNLNPTGIAKINSNKKSISFLKPGNFTANILLEHPTKQDVSISKAQFEIAKAVSKNQLTFPKLSKNFATNGTFSEQEILNNITGKKDGYTLKEISNLNPTGIAKINSNKKSISFLKPGSFTVNILLKHPTKQDVSISKAAFEIKKSAAEKLTFSKLSENFTDKGTFSEQEILNNITGKKDGYTLKEISNLNPTGIAKINSNKKSISFLKPGTFTANIVLEHSTKQDVSIPKAAFTIFNSFDKTFGSANKDVATCVVQSNDGGYIVAGYTEISSSNDDYWIVKIDAFGTKKLELKSNLRYDDRLHAIVKTDDGNYIAVGFGRKNTSNGTDLMVIKFDDALSVTWTKFFGGSKTDKAHGICKTNDGKFIVVGYIGSSVSRKYNGHAVKLNTQGTADWEKSFGDNAKIDRFYGVTQDSSGDYILVGETKRTTNYDGWVVKLDANGNQKKESTFNKGKDDKLYAIYNNPASGSYWAAGKTKRGSYYDAWVLELDGNLNSTQQITAGKSSASESWDSIAYDADQDHYVVAGTHKITAKKYNFWIKAINPTNYQDVWERNFGGSEDDKAHQIIKTSDGGFMVVGETSSKGSGDSDFWVLKLDHQAKL